MCTGVHELYSKVEKFFNLIFKKCVQVYTMTGPRRPELVKKILRELRKHPEGIWIRKLARNLGEPVMTVHKYVTREDSGYPGKFIEIVQELPTERGGNTIIRLKKIKMKD